MAEVREFTERQEESLSPYAARSRLSKGRLKNETPCPIRTAFARDRDRIIHSNSFRRLKHKTQVFITPLDDHYVTRLTHTLEVAQVARTISRALALNEDLTEAIALGHDLGHTPFGHVGEEVLDELYHGGFRHNEQSLRVVELLENNGQGLNLTWEVRDGIVHHSKARGEILGDGWEPEGTLEGEVVRLADMVAYINHDIDDAIRAMVITERDLPLTAIKVTGYSRSERINTMIHDIIRCSWDVRGEKGKVANPRILMSPEIAQATHSLREFLFERVYNLNSARGEVNMARDVVRKLYHYYNENESLLPPEYRFGSDEMARRVVDYISGMTDQYAIKLAGEILA
ncbi:MAG: deoxyguanosinetriphosphate triphosphohydrolase [Dehalococcoidales bacterium]|jgi:dGTPase